MASKRLRELTDAPARSREAEARAEQVRTELDARLRDCAEAAVAQSRAALLRAQALLAELGVDVDLIAAVPAVENMPGPYSTRPGDVVTALNGKSVEITNTDAGPYDALMVNDGLISNGNYGLDPSRTAARTFLDLLTAGLPGSTF